MEDYYDDADREKTMRRNKPKKRKRWGVRLFFAFLILAVAVVAWGYHRLVLTPIDVEKATPQEAVGWLVLRDFSEESEKTRSELFNYFFSNLASPQTDANSDNDANPDQKAPTSLQLPEKVRSVAGIFLVNADEQTRAWSQKYERPAYLRVDYLYEPTRDRRSEFVLSADVKPGPSLTKRWQARRVAAANGLVKRKNLEKNIQLLVMQWFLEKCAEYDSTPDEKKREFLEKTAVELESLQNLYQSVRVSANKAPLPRVKMLAEFERQLEGWCETASQEDLAKAMWLKDLLVAVVVAREAGVPQLVAPPRVDEKMFERVERRAALEELRALEEERDASDETVDEEKDAARRAKIRAQRDPMKTRVDFLRDRANAYFFKAKTP